MVCRFCFALACTILSDSMSCLFLSCREGAGLILQLLADDKNIVTSIKSELMKQVSDLNTPL